MKRVQETAILKDLTKKMAFLVGPRQVGKTHLSKTIASHFSKSVYLNWDALPDRKLILNQSWLPDTEILILDELHKMPKWKNYLKGLYDTKPEYLKILVTGSARLDVFQKAGDSLAGRYFIHHLLPLSPSELKQLGRTVDLNQLMKRGGFPEPFLAESDEEAARWRLQYITSLITVDVLDFEKIYNLQAMRTIFELLRSSVGSPISYDSISRDVSLSPTTVKKYIQVLESLYIIFKVTPYSKNIARSLLKLPKIYFFDTALVNGDKGALFENLAAINLLKHVYAKKDYEGKACELHFLRDKEKREVDFAIVTDNKIEMLIEAKYSDNQLRDNLKHFSKQYELPAKQIVYHLRHSHIVEGISIVDAKDFFTSLKL
jgi:hypothetical protein